MLSKYVRYLVKEHAFTVFALVFAIVYWISAHSLPRASLVFPKALGYLLVPLFLWNAVDSVRGFRKTLASDKPEAQKWDCTLNFTTPKVVVTVAILLYIVAMPLFGFISSSAVFLIGLSYYLGVRDVFRLLAFTAIYIASIYILFVVWLGMRLPSGVLL